MLNVVSITDIGQKRRNNQDYVFTSTVSIGALPNLFLVADGMGGHNAGDYASKFAVKKIVENIGLSKMEHEENVEDIIRHGFFCANDFIRKKALEYEDLHGMGTTMVAATIVNKFLHVANIGDSRLYIVRDTIEQITKDHSLVAEMVRLGGIKQEEARMHPDKNIITRAIGATEELDVDFFKILLKPNDEILMCTDGLTNMVPDNEIFNIMKKPISTAKKAEDLVKLANENGGMDNLGIIIISQSNEKHVMEAIHD
ncbi:MAG: Stp1/IreP family PP2C-type Ser/Thr phosphatase [Lachnospiraceae bacterium]